MQKLITLGVLALSIIATSLSTFAGEKDYMVIDLSGGVDAKKYPITYLNAVPEGGWTDEYKTTKLVLRRIEAGIFMKGGLYDALGKSYNKKKQEVTLTKGFYIGVFEVTQRQWELVKGSNPSHFQGNTNPVGGVSYENIRSTLTGSQWPKNNEAGKKSFMGQLRAKTGKVFDLPTEAQWEYACRAGTTTALNNGKNLTPELDACPNLDEVAWYDKNSDKKPHPVGLKKPNAWGLYDMHGNVFEWCLDWNESLDIPSRSSRLFRGGSWSSNASYCRSVSRNYNTLSSVNNYYGFRTAMTLP